MAQCLTPDLELFQVRVLFLDRFGLDSGEPKRNQKTDDRDPQNQHQDIAPQIRQRADYVLNRI
jgi:hypothetical protein